MEAFAVTRIRDLGTFRIVQDPSRLHSPPVVPSLCECSDCGRVSREGDVVGRDEADSLVTVSNPHMELVEISLRCWLLFCAVEVRPNEYVRLDELEAHRAWWKQRLWSARRPEELVARMPLPLFILPIVSPSVVMVPFRASPAAVRTAGALV